MGIERSHKYFVAQNCQAAIHASAARSNVIRQGSLVLPDRATRSRIQRECTIVRSRAIKNSVHNERSRFEFSAGHGLISPFRHQLLHVAYFNFLQCRKSSPRIVSRIHQPVLRFAPGIRQPFRGHLSIGRHRNHTIDQNQPEVT